MIQPGVWIAHNPGEVGGLTPFGTEIDALREAVRASKQVTFVPFGSAIDDIERAAWDRLRDRCKAKP